MNTELFREFEDGRAVVLDDNGSVLRQLVKFERLPSGKTKFSRHDVPLCYPSKKDAATAARKMGWPLDRLEKGRSLIGDFWFIRNDFRDKYALACWSV